MCESSNCCPECARKIDEMHTLLKEFKEMIESLGKNPMLRAMVPPGVLKR